MTSGYDCGKQRKSGTVGYLLNQSSDKSSITTTGGEAKLLAESEFAAPTITKLIPISFSTSGAYVAYHVNPVADQFQRAFQTSTISN
ncbi:hypothetical protein R3W88_029302 [Solanum pinnatisectum]|uniref:Uncharacterized protein n=1 Tax=Solanum pinnatisectum TaxID=50273 RepID=A0AAV9K561_9SOLN|nr:hypothetical protein R3W88_029302 [Solanum pinnatisectum]